MSKQDTEFEAALKSALAKLQGVLEAKVNGMDFQPPNFSSLELLALLKYLRSKPKDDDRG